jgi:hypothetical protein
MKNHIFTALFITACGLTAPTVTLAAPIDNGDGSQTCNASGPSGGTTDGVCANDLATNESFCDGGMSSEPGGGTTCSESRTQADRKAMTKVRKN